MINSNLKVSQPKSFRQKVCRYSLRLIQNQRYCKKKTITEAVEKVLNSLNEDNKGGGLDGNNNDSTK